MAITKKSLIGTGKSTKPATKSAKLSNPPAANKVLGASKMLGASKAVGATKVLGASKMLGATKVLGASRLS